jgi:signal transduction histidine kinase
MPNALAEIVAAPDRLRAIAEAGLLDALPDEVFDRLTRLACRITGAPSAVVSLVDDRRQVFLSQFGRSAPPGHENEVPLSASFCQHVVAGAEPLVITDALTHPLVHDNDAALDGSVRSYAGMPLRSPDGHVLGSFCAFGPTPHEWSPDQLAVLADLAMAVETEIALRQSLRERDRLAAIKENLLAVVSHELRNPLTGLLGALKLRAARDGATVDPLLRIALSSAERMLRLTNDLLDFDHVERGGVEITLAPVRCHEALAAAVESYGALATEAGCVLRVGTANGTLRGDADRIQQVLGNLIGNAVKFTPPGGVVELASAIEGDVVRIDVRDQGRGIPPEMRDRIFEPFAQVEAADRTKKGGAGLGLAITRSLVERMGGTVAVTSEVGKGSTFSVRLPGWGAMD